MDDKERNKVKEQERNKTKIKSRSANFQASKFQHPTNQTHNPQLHTRPTTWKPQHKIPQAATTV